MLHLQLQSNRSGREEGGGRNKENGGGDNGGGGYATLKVEVHSLINT